LFIESFSRKEGEDPVKPFAFVGVKGGRSHTPR